MNYYKLAQVKGINLSKIYSKHVNLLLTTQLLFIEEQIVCHRNKNYNM